MGDEWENRRHMLGEQCDGCGGWREQVFGLDLDQSVRLWFCRSCWVRQWRDTPGAREVLWNEPESAVLAEIGTGDE